MSLQNQITNLSKGIENLKNYSTSGDLTPHEAYLLIKESGIEDLFKETLNEVKSVAIENIKMNYLEGNDKSYKENGYMFTVRGGATRYYFTDVPEVKDAKYDLEKSFHYKKLKETEAKYKTAFLMKQKNQAMVDEETGEIVDVSNVKVVYSPDSLSIKKLG